MEKVGKEKFALSYLPDAPSSHVSLDFLYTVLNTLDSNFFIRVVDEFDAKYGAKLGKKPEKVLEVVPEMLNLLERF